jgi:hypothetical protein
MATFVTDKKKITEAILKLIKPEYTASQLEVCLFKWWKNPRSSGGLRLTDVGKEAFDEALIEHTTHPYSIDPPRADGFSIAMIELGKKMPCPYYMYSIKHMVYVSVYDGRMSTVLYLYEDIVSYLKTQ